MIKTTLIIFLVAIIAIMWLTLANRSTNALELKAQCIELVAKEQGYKGNPASKEAWDLFSNKCN